jgi:hypothetical protein
MNESAEDFPCATTDMRKTVTQEKKNSLENAAHDIKQGDNTP